MGQFELPPLYELSSLQRIQTAIQPPWIILAGAQAGRRHFEKGEPCQDSHVLGGFGNVIWMVLADGVSSAPRSQHGSALACQAVHHYLGREISRGTPPTPAMLRAAIGSAHIALVDTAKASRRSVRDYASTLAVGVIAGDRLLAASIGDSSVATSTIINRFGGKKERVFTSFCSGRQSGISDMTWDITSAEWMDATHVAENANSAIDLFMMATDGGHNFFVHPDGEGHVFDPAYPEFLLANLKSKETGPLLVGNVFAQFMKKVDAENRDDRTILIATRIPDAHSLPAAEVH